MSRPSRTPIHVQYPSPRSQSLPINAQWAGLILSLILAAIPIWLTIRQEEQQQQINTLQTTVNNQAAEQQVNRNTDRLLTENLREMRTQRTEQDRVLGTRRTMDSLALRDIDDNLQGIMGEIVWVDSFTIDKQNELMSVLRPIFTAPDINPFILRESQLLEEWLKCRNQIRIYDKMLEMRLPQKDLADTFLIIRDLVVAIRGVTMRLSGHEA